jgi:fido (protein-threonine AMPylation protein)
LVHIHPFPNGNGRHARLMADTILFNLDRARFTWGSGDLYRRGDARDRYLAALREADRSNIAPLLEFVRS